MKIELPSCAAVKPAQSWNKIEMHKNSQTTTKKILFFILIILSLSINDETWNKFAFSER